LILPNLTRSCWRNWKSSFGERIKILHT
jgi:hypothetical protein